MNQPIPQSENSNGKKRGNTQNPFFGIVVTLISIMAVLSVFYFTNKDDLPTRSTDDFIISASQYPIFDQNPVDDFFDVG